MKTIYVDTSVYEGKFDDEFAFWSEQFFQKIIDSDIKIMVSDVVISELDAAPLHVRNFVNALPNKNLLEVSLDDTAVLLGQKYISENVVGQTSLNDCFHIAIATLYKADLLVSWNFKHIVNIERIHGYNAVNLKKGYQLLEIRTPREAFDYEDDD